MKKSNEVKKVNRIAKAINRDLRSDVFGNRFEVRQYQKARVDGTDYFLYQLIDNVQPERNYLIQYWLTVYDANRKIYQEVNDFIIYSNFWSLYFNDQSRYDIEMDSYLKKAKN